VRRDDAVQTSMAQAELIFLYHPTIGFSNEIAVEID
jgi:hypothetical protein